MSFEFRLPDIGEGLHEAELVTWFIQNGDHVKENENIAEVQTDKASVEISSPYTGKVVSLGAKEGEVIKVGEVLVSFEEKAEKVEKSAASSGKKQIPAAPVVRKLARKLGVDIHAVTPTGKGGRVTAEDVRNHVEDYKTPASVNATKTKDEAIPAETRTHRVEPIKGLRKQIYQNMTRAKEIIPHCIGMDEVNAEKLTQLRDDLTPELEGRGIQLTYLPFIVKAVTRALKKISRFNGTVDDEAMEFHYHAGIHIGIATATEEGLIVPVIKQADGLSIIEIAEQIQDLSDRARQKRLKPEELKGSTFTISNTGKKGGWFATPIINYPEVAILGIHRMEKKPIVVNDRIEIGYMMGMSLTFDHRVIDGEHCGEFMTEVKSYLEKPELLILDSR
ncbi:dihydrolipoamide acetyltransferase family protein [Alteribacillus sp. JSM 102045]|uniref:dihydrolipoamide acetyltransferase family protein n=1 Tax=Alteribacillus sp. JSM 102045 TaxID=1562101 RepID=UPI0035C1007D